MNPIHGNVLVLQSCFYHRKKYIISACPSSTPNTLPLE